MKQIPTAKDIDFSQFDWLDFGASKAASIDYGKQHLGGKNGLGVDLNPDRVKAMNQSGYHAMVGDLTKLDVPANCVRFVKMAHILEHMPDLAGVEAAVAAGAKAASEFMVITGPYFDHEAYLAKHGFKLYWSDYDVHTCHLTVAQLIKILDKLKLHDYELYLRYPIIDSKDRHIQPLKTPPNEHHYDAAKHPSKKGVNFDEVVWRDFVAYVRLGQVRDWHKITQAYPHQIPYLFKSKDAVFQVPQRMLSELAEADLAHQAAESSVQNLKRQKTDLQHQLDESRKSHGQLKDSKAFKATRQLQRVSFAARHPAKAIKKISGRL